MKIKLKNDWDIPIRPPTPSKKEEGYFIGRKKELLLLTNEILRKNSGSILISGYRGVGKTSLLYEALNKIENRNEKIIIVLLNASQLDTESCNDNINSKKILENLIRRLYTAVKGNKILKYQIKSKIETLYRKAKASDYRETEFNQKQLELSKGINTEHSLELKLNEKYIVQICFIISWALAVSLQFANIIKIEWLNKLVPLLLAFPIPFTINFFYRKHSYSKNLDKFKSNTEEIYQFDNNIGNLEFDLDEIHSKIKANGQKLIYIIDELDKIEPDLIKEILKYFKNFFTLTDALFIFVGGEEMYKMISSANNEDKKGLYRSKEYTYFTSIYFLARPTWPDLSDYLNAIVDPEKKRKETEFEIFKRALSFDARNDFFDLKNFVKDRIVDFSEIDEPIIDIENSDEDIKKSRLHKAITVLFEGKYLSASPSKWHTNESLLRLLFKQAHEIYKSFSGKNFQDPEGETIEDEIIRDFNGFMSQIKAFEVDNDPKKNIGGLEVTIRTYRYTGSLPIETPDTLSDLTEFERRFISEFDNYCNYLLVLINILRKAKGDSELNIDGFWEVSNKLLPEIDKWGFSFSQLFNQQHPVYKEIKNNRSSLVFRRDEIEKKTKEIKNHLEHMLSSFYKITATMFRNLYDGLNLKLQSKDNIKNTSLIIDSSKESFNFLKLANYIILYKPDYSRQILVIQDKLEILRSIRNEINDNLKTFRVIGVNKHRDNLSVKGLHIILTESHEKFKASINKVYDEISKFLLD